MTTDKSMRLLAAGSGARQLAAVQYLAARAHVTHIQTAAQADALPTAAYDALILPMLPAADGRISADLTLAQLLHAVRPGGSVFGGRMSDTDRARIRSAGLIPADYAAAEPFARRNAVPTAEGALAIALTALPVTLHRLPVLLLGAGRISGALIPRLRALGADLTVLARKPADRARLWTDGVRTAGFAELPACIGSFRLIVNTVPAQLLTDDVLAHARADALILDLASLPGGDDGGVTAYAAPPQGRNPRLQCARSATHDGGSRAAHMPPRADRRPDAASGHPCKAPRQTARPRPPRCACRRRQIPMHCH